MNDDSDLEVQDLGSQNVDNQPLLSSETIHAIVVRAIGDPSPAGRCPWIRPADRLLVNLAGYHDPFYWPTMQEWVEQIVLWIIKTGSDPSFTHPEHASINLSAVRQRFVRFRCVACKNYCENFDPLTAFQPAVALPCGHIMDAACYSLFLTRFREGEVSYECPWRGPSKGEPVDWTPECGKRIVYDCNHPSMCITLPAMDESLCYVPEEVFVPSDGFIPNNCRRCEIKNILVTWTKDARRVSGSPKIFAVFAYPPSFREETRIPGLPIDGLLEGEFRVWGTHPMQHTQQIQAQRTLTIERFLEKTPTPMEWIMPANEEHPGHRRKKYDKPVVMYYNLCGHMRMNTGLAKSFDAIGTRSSNGYHDNCEPTPYNGQNSSQMVIHSDQARANLHVNDHPTKGIHETSRVDDVSQLPEDYAVQEADNAPGEYTIQGMDGMDLDYAHAAQGENGIPRIPGQTEAISEKTSNQSGPMTQIL